VVLLVPHQGRLGGADHRTGQRVALAQVGHLVSAQNPAHAAGWDTQLGTEPVLAAVVFLPGGNDLVLDLVSGPVRTVVWLRGPVREASRAFGVEPGVRCPAGHPRTCPRGRDPSPFDRVQANGLTAHCIEYLAEQLESGGRASAMIGFQSGRLQLTDLTSYPQLIEEKAQRPREQRWMSQLPLAEIMTI